MNINKLMKQAQEMQKKMDKMQEEMGELEIQGTAGGGMVTITVSGRGDAKKVEIADDLLNSDDDDSAEMLGDLIVAAFNDAKRKAEEEMQKQMGDAMGGMGLPPGMKLPF